MTTTATTYPPRPKRFDAGVLKDAAELAYKALVDADALEDAADDEGRKQDELHDLAAALSGSGRPDGYAIARELDGAGWEVDAETVEILNRDFVDEALTAATRLWVKAYGGPALPPLGARVQVLTGGWELAKGTVLVVVKHNADTATIVANDSGQGQNGWVLPVERVEVLTQDGAA